jgi:hypothetical protein
MRRTLLLTASLVGLVGAAGWLHEPKAAQALPVVTGPSQASRIDPDLSHMLTLLGGRRGEVRCWSSSDWRQRSAEFALFAGAPGSSSRTLAGFLSLDRERINLPGETCNRLDGLGVSSADAYAAKVFAHELQHFRGVRDEAAAECFGVQTVASVAVAAGLDGARAKTLAATAWNELYLDESPVYRTPACADGGPLDLRPASATWP